jgi:hypothetical protein
MNPHTARKINTLLSKKKEKKDCSAQKIIITEEKLIKCSYWEAVLVLFCSSVSLIVGGRGAKRSGKGYLILTFYLIAKLSLNTRVSLNCYSWRSLACTTESLGVSWTMIVILCWTDYPFVSWIKSLPMIHFIFFSFSLSQMLMTISLLFADHTPLHSPSCDLSVIPDA